MIKKISIVIITFVIIIFTTNLCFADGKQPPPPSKSGKFSKGNFSKKSSWNSKGPGSSSGPAKGIPDPDDGGGGGPMPIPSGLTFLLIGSAFYFGKKLRDENK